MAKKDKEPVEKKLTDDQKRIIQLEVHIEELEMAASVLLSRSGCTTLLDVGDELIMHRENVARFAERFGVKSETPMKLKISMINDATKKMMKYME